MSIVSSETISFPSAGLLPKAETGVTTFLQKYPDYNGKDVTIAIFDSGVDPRANGLQTLCDGRSVKVIQRFDCSGSGDVDTTKKVTADDDGYITGLSGRRLKLTPEMMICNAANGEYRLGLKVFTDLFPQKVRENMYSKNKLKNWDSPHKTAIADISRKINEFESQHSDASKFTWDKKLVKENLDNTLELLNNYEKNFHDVKISYDCVLYKTESHWQVVIDTTEKGDLESAVHLSEYTKNHEVKNLNEFVSVSVNVHDNGDVLEIVGMCSSHGTHVSAIASGFNCAKDVDGVAPNANIVSLTIGESRLGSMETGTALVRAMMKVMELCRNGTKIDVINMSYGEHSHWSNTGRIGELMTEVVNKYGVVWVASAGNHGPALSTVGTPPDICQNSCIGVGAYVSPAMMEAEYAMRERLAANVYTWTSRDPCIDGGQGVTVCAPGGAITSVPQYTMSKAALMNGTSMAAPHVAGAVALLISGLKQRGISYTPFSIKRAISVTATKLDYVDPFAQGHGLLNIEKAFNHLVEHRDSADNMLRFSVRCGPEGAKGIIVRQGELKKPLEQFVTIEPFFFNERDTDAKDKYNFNVRLSLISSQPWVHCGAFLDLSYNTRSINVKVDPSALQPGVHTAVIQAFDSDCVQKGSLFEIPVTVIQPRLMNCEESRVFEPTGNQSDGSFEFQPHTIRRDFILVPNKATWAVLRLRCTDKNRTNLDIGKFYIHTMQLLPKASCRVMETQKLISVNNEQDSVLAFKVQEQNILELCIAKYWSNYGVTHIKYGLEFRGIQFQNKNWGVMQASRGIQRIEISSLSQEEIQPQIQIKSAAVVLKPTEAKISPLSATRDVIPEGRQIYQNILTYMLNLTKSQEIAIYSPILSPLLYEAEFESQIWMIFDCNKSMVACGDAHSSKVFTKFDKGEYTIRMQVRHEKRDFLEKISETNMVVLYKLSNSLNFDIYDHYNRAVVNGNKFNSCIIKDGIPKVLYISPITQERLNKANIPANASWLSGTTVLAKDENGRRVDIYDFTYVLAQVDNAKPKNGNGNSTNSITASTIQQKENKINQPISSNSSICVTSPLSSNSGDGNSKMLTTIASSTASPSKKRGTTDEYAEGLRDFQCSMLSKLDSEHAEKIFQEVVVAHPKHFVAQLNMIQNIEINELKSSPTYPFAFVQTLEKEETISEGVEQNCKLKFSLERVAQLALDVIKGTDKDALLAFYGMKCDPRPDASKIKANMDKQRNNLLEALVKRGIVLAKIAIIQNNLKGVLTEMDEIHTEIIKFIDHSDNKVIQFSVWHAYANEHFGRLHKYLTKLHEDKRAREVIDEIKHCCVALKLDHVAAVVDQVIVSSYPQSYRPF